MCFGGGIVLTQACGITQAKPEFMIEDIWSSCAKLRTLDVIIGMSAEQN